MCDTGKLLFEEKKGKKNFLKTIDDLKNRLEDETMINFPIKQRTAAMVH